MSIEIKVVETKKDLKTFIKVPFKIFEDNPYWVPPLIRDELDVFDKNKNPAYETADSKLFLALKNGKPVGRIAAIVSKIANEKYETKNLRFGWFDVIDDFEVTNSLFNAVEEWGRELGLNTLTGPHGFSDLDPEGMLVFGFDQLPTIAVYYNHEYYPVLTEKYGFQKEVDYIEFQTTGVNENGIPEKLLRISERIRQRSNLRLIKIKRKKQLFDKAEEIFQVLDESFEEIYGTVPMNENQLKYYVKKYISFLNKDLTKIAVNENGEVIGFMISMPSLSKAFQKAKGRLFPFGWFHVLKALNGNNETIDFCLAGIKKNYRGLGVDLLMGIEIAKEVLRRGIKYSESNPELEENKKIQAQWKYFNPKLHKKRRIYKKNIN
jgi:hypothetical protein